MQNVSATNHDSSTYDTTETEILQDMPDDLSSYAASTTKRGIWLVSLTGKWWYRHLDGTYTKDDWEYINEKWYLFDSNGYMQTGWLLVNGKWYYLNTNGAMQTGWLQLDGKWYYLNADGLRTSKTVNGVKHEYYYVENTTVRRYPPLLISLMLTR